MNFINSVKHQYDDATHPKKIMLKFYLITLMVLAIFGVFSTLGTTTAHAVEDSTNTFDYQGVVEENTVSETGGKAGILQSEQRGGYEDLVNLTMRNSGYHILTAIAEGRVLKGDTVETLKTSVPEAFTVYPGVSMALAKWNPSDPADFALCGWSTQNNISATTGFIYRSVDDTFPDRRLDCSKTSTELNTYSVELTESESPEIASFPSASTPIERSDALPQAQEPATNDNDDSSPMLLNIILVILLLSLLAGAFIGVSFFGSKTKKKVQARNGNIANWNSLIARSDAISKEWTAYELDPVRILDLPLLSDMREVSTVKFHNALRRAKHLRPSHVSKVSTIDADTSPFAHAVQDLEEAFHVAEVEAKRVRWNHFSPDERKRLQTAKNLLNLAMDGAASDAERQAAYKRMQKELDGLIVVPQATALKIEKSINLAITA